MDGRLKLHWRKNLHNFNLEFVLRSHAILSFHGCVGKDVVNRLYQENHLFALPSLRDGGGSGMLEAIDRGMPVLALDWGGPSDVSGASGAGMLFPVTNPAETIHTMRNWLEHLFEGRIQYSALVSTTRNFDVNQFSWEFKSNTLQSALTEAVSGTIQPNSTI